MVSFSGRLNRSAYLKRLVGVFLLWFITLIIAAYMLDYGSVRISRQTFNLIGIGTTAVAAISLLSIAVRRVRDIGLFPALAIIPLVLGPFGLGFLAVIPSSSR